MNSIWNDLRYAARMLLKNRAFTVIALLTLALGIGANTAIFSVVNAIVFRPLPYSAPQQLVGMWTKDVRRPGAQNPTSLPVLRDWQQQSKSFSGIAAYAFNRFTVTGAEGADQTRGVLATSNFFTVMGVTPKLGRALQASDDRERVVVLSDELWRRRFNSDPQVLGKTINLNAEPFTIIGVMPSSFRFPTPDIELWCSMGPIYAIAPGSSVGDWVNNRSLRGYRAVGRLQEGATIEQAQAEMAAIAERLAKDYPDSDAGIGVVLVPLYTQMVGKVRQPLLVLLVAVGFILLIACANVANLLMARTAARDREIAIRRAMGAGQVRLIRQMLTESLLLATLGGSLGLLIAIWGVQLLIGLSPKDIPRLEGVGVDRWALLFTFGIAMGTGILFGLAPAWHARRLSLNDTLREGGRGVSGFGRLKRMRGVLVVSEIALAVVLLVGAGLMLKSFEKLTDVNPGFDSNNLLTMSIALPPVRYQEPAKQIAYFEQALERVRSLPGVVAAGACTSMPPEYIQQGSGFTIEGRPPQSGALPTALYMPATPGFLEALGVPLINGRTINASDTPQSQGVVVINETFAQRFFDGQEPVGQRMTLGGVLRTIVGVVGDAKYQGLGNEAGLQAYVPHSQNPFPGMRILVRTSVDPSSLIAAVRNQIQSVDPQEGPTRFATMNELLSNSVAQPRFNTFLIALFALLAFTLATIGIYGVISYEVTQRTGEIGIRIALGARTLDVLQLILRQGLLLTFGGLVVGIAASIALTRFLSSLLFEVKPTDLMTFVLVAGVLTVVALVASLIPARRASKVDPLEALRYE